MRMRSSILSILSMALLVTGNLRASPESDRDEILRAVLQDVVTNGFLKATRDFYGNPGDTNLALVSDATYGVSWPTNFNPGLPGFATCFVSAGNKGPDASAPHRLGIRIDVFDLSKRPEAHIPAGDRGAPVAVTIYNAGGHGKEAVIGGCSVYYLPKRQGNKWIVKCLGADDS
jgi:hypothetical protein